VDTEHPIGQAKDFHEHTTRARPELREKACKAIVEAVIDPASNGLEFFPEDFPKVRPLPTMSASWDDAERICSRRDFRSLTHAAEVIRKEYHRLCRRAIEALAIGTIQEG
jgi:hypothetical protein